MGDWQNRTTKLNELEHAESYVDASAEQALKARELIQFFGRPSTIRGSRFLEFWYASMRWLCFEEGSELFSKSLSKGWFRVSSFQSEQHPGICGESLAPTMEVISPCESAIRSSGLPRTANPPP